MKKLTIPVIVAVAILGGILAYTKYGNKNKNPEDSQKASVGSLTSENQETYTDPFGRFSFMYPKDFTVTNIEGEEGDTLLIKKAQISNDKSQNTSNQTKPEEFQIFVSEFDEPDPITAERIKQDIPDMEIIQPQNVLVGKEKNIQAVIFLSSNESFGKTREIWFTDRGLLFQITGYEGTDDIIGPILETLSFE